LGHGHPRDGRRATRGSREWDGRKGVPCASKCGETRLRPAGRRRLLLRERAGQAVVGTARRRVDRVRSDTGLHLTETGRAASVSGEKQFGSPSTPRCPSPPLPPLFPPTPCLPPPRPPIFSADLPPDLHYPTVRYGPHETSRAMNARIVA